MSLMAKSLEAAGTSPFTALLSYPQPGVPTGKLSDKITHTSKLYDGMKSDYWIYVPAGYNPNIPAAFNGLPGW